MDLQESDTTLTSEEMRQLKETEKYQLSHKNITSALKSGELQQLTESLVALLMKPVEYADNEMKTMSGDDGEYNKEKQDKFFKLIMNGATNKKWTSAFKPQLSKVKLLSPKINTDLTLANEKPYQKAIFEVAMLAGIVILKDDPSELTN